MGQKQINVRLATEDVRVLAVAAFLDDQSIAEYLKPMLVELAADLRRDPLVARMLETKAVKEAQRDGSVSLISDRRRKGGSS